MNCFRALSPRLLLSGSAEEIATAARIAPEHLSIRNTGHRNRMIRDYASDSCVILLDRSRVEVENGALMWVQEIDVTYGGRHGVDVEIYGSQALAQAA